jgi:hypothetical protein
MEGPLDASPATGIVPASAPAPKLTTVVEQSARVALGIASLTVGAALEALERSLGKEGVPTASGPQEPPAGLALLAGAGLGLAAEAARDGVRIARAMGEVASVFVRALSSEAIARRLDPLDRGLIELNRIWEGEQPRSERAAEAFAGALLPEIVGAVVDQLDLTNLVRDNVDLDRVVAGIDVDAVVDRIDVQDIARRVDVDEIVERVDLDRVVDRIDVNEIASRVDLEALIARLDLASLAQDVIDELDLASLVRESSGAMAAETVDELRLQGVGADRLVSRVVDRILRRDGRDEDGAAPSEPGSAGPDAGAVPPGERERS